jgi:pentatricopeptide repeat protein
MHEFSQLDDFESVFSAFSSMKEAGIQPDMYSYRSLIDACAHLGEVDKAISIFEVQFTTPSQLSVCLLLDVALPVRIKQWLFVLSLSNGGKTKTFLLRLFQEILSSGIRPNVFVYNSLMNVRAEDTPSVWQLYIDMQVSYSRGT